MNLRPIYFRLSRSRSNPREGAALQFCSLKLPQAIETFLFKHSQHTLDRPPRHSSQFRNALVNFSLALEQDDLHPLLHARIGVIIPLLGQRLLNFLGENESTHPCIPARPFREISPTTFVGVPRFAPILPSCPHLLQEQFVSFHREPSIIERAGLVAWPKPIHNLRASRQTELAAVHSIHVVCQWIGNSAAITQAHYLQVTDGDFDRAAKSGAIVVQKAVQTVFDSDEQELANLSQVLTGGCPATSLSHIGDIVYYLRQDSNLRPDA